MPIHAVETRRLYQQVAGQLGELIRQGEFAVGRRLPPERDLARQLGVSRPVVREAMVALELAGLVEVRTGSGAYVRAGPDGVQPLILPDAGASPLEVIVARQLLEPEIAALAAGSRTPADLAAIAAALEQMRHAMATGGDTMSADRLFHTKIAAATRNALLVSFVDQLWESIFAPLYRGLSDRLGLPENRRAALLGHDRILAALRGGDAAAARAAMQAHLAEVVGIMLADDDLG